MNKIDARKCKLNTVDNQLYKEFVEENHNQGFAKAKVVYGLFFEGELVQLMSFGKPRYNKNYQWEIIRECTKKDYTVRGGTSKLWKFFINNNACHSCICYSYPHNEEFTNHYIDYCGFTNKTRYNKNSKQTYYVGEYNGEQKRYSNLLL